MLQVQFDTEIKSYEIPAFRSAIIEKAGRENTTFHNHISDTKLMYAYPVIQYKIIRKQPSIICLDFGVDEIHHFFQNKDWQIHLSGRDIQLKVADLRLNQFNMQIGDSLFQYKIFNWLALNERNFETYAQMGSEAEKKQLLQRILIGNILSFAKGIKWDIDKTIHLEINEIVTEKPLRFKGARLLGLTVGFSTNVFLPNNIGLGKGVSHGFGIVRQIKERNK